jgi:methyl coenzyme M reductase alpha subunit
MYAARDSEVNLLLERHFKDGEIFHGAALASKMTLRLARGPQNALPNQWILAELLHKEWIAP